MQNSFRLPGVQKNRKHLFYQPDAGLIMTTYSATSSPGSSRFPMWRRRIGKREDPGGKVAYLVDFTNNPLTTPLNR